MKAVFWSPEKPMETGIMEAMGEGLAQHGDRLEVARVHLDSEPIQCDVAFLFGVKRFDLIRKHQAFGIPVVYFDKGYSRERINGSTYYRCAVNAHQPTDQLNLTGADLPSARADRFKWTPKPWRRAGGAVVIAGSSEKYHRFFDLPHPTTWATKVVNELRGRTSRPIIYRPKPSWQGAVPIRGSVLVNTGGLESLLADAHCLITHGSSACLEAVLSGVPSIVLGNAVARPVSSTSLNDVDDPKMVGTELRREWLRRLSWWQWSLSEMQSGAMWTRVRSLLRQ